MEQWKIDRINELAHKVRDGLTLTPEELAQRDALRQEYIAAVRQSLTAQLDNTFLVDEQGNRHRLTPKQEPQRAPKCKE